MIKPSYQEKTIEGNIYYFSMSKTSSVAHVVKRICDLSSLSKKHFGNVILDLTDAKDADTALLNRATKALVSSGRIVVTVGKTVKGLDVYPNLGEAVDAVKAAS